MIQWVTAAVIGVASYYVGKKIFGSDDAAPEGPSTRGWKPVPAPKTLPEAMLVKLGTVTRFVRFNMQALQGGQIYTALGTGRVKAVSHQANRRQWMVELINLEWEFDETKVPQPEYQSIFYLADEHIVMPENGTGAWKPIPRYR